MKLVHLMRIAGFRPLGIPVNVLEPEQGVAAVQALDDTSRANDEQSPLLFPAGTSTNEIVYWSQPKKLQAVPSTLLYEANPDVGNAKTLTWWLERHVLAPEIVVIPFPSQANVAVPLVTVVEHCPEAEPASKAKQTRST